MKKTNLYAKKTLSVFLAVLMLMSAWVWVAPEKAEAATAGRYYIKYVVNVTDTGTEKDNNFQISYKTNNGKGEQVTDKMLQDAEKFNWSGNNVTVWEGYIDGFPTQTWHHYAFNMNTRTERHENIRLFVGKDANNLSSTSVLATSGNAFTYKNAAQDNRMNVESGFPYQNSITGMSNLSVTIAKDGTGKSSTTTGVVYDQYGVSWYQAPNYAISLNKDSQSDVAGIKVVTSGDGAYVEVTDIAELLKSQYGYDASTGKMTLYLRATSGDAVATSTITITAPKYTISFKDTDGNVDTETHSYYYGYSVPLAEIAKNHTNSIKHLNNSAEHTHYVWNANTNHVLTKDYVVEEKSGDLEAHDYDTDGNGKIEKADYSFTADGHYQVCTICKYQTTPANHVDNASPTTDKARTCTTGGQETHYCGTCTYSWKVATEPLGHSWVAATCQAPKTCSVCGETEGEKDPTKHTKPEQVAGSASTCGQPGYTTGVKCGDCGEWITAPTQLPTLPHKWNPATCQTVKTCPDCGATEGEKDPTNHTNIVSFDKKDSTCTQEGYEAGKRCADCGTVTEGGQVIPVKPHDFSEATCQAPKTCKDCSHTEGDVNPDNHTNLIVLNGKEADCTKTGLTDGEMCYDCKVVTIPQEEIPAKGHDWIPANCTNPKTCSVCGATEGTTADHIWIDATCQAPKTCSICHITDGDVNPNNHTSLEVVEGYAPDCDETGLTDGEKCTACGVTTIPQEVIPALGHKWIDADCTTPKTCSVCGATEGEAAGHAWDSGVQTKAPTCINKGIRTYTCTRGNCSEQYTEEIPATGIHVYSDWTRVDEYTHTSYCISDKDCTYETVENHEFTDDCWPVEGGTGHDYACKCNVRGAVNAEGKHMQNATVACFGEGVEFKALNADEHKETCICGRERKAAHNMLEVEDERVEATCTEDGSATYKCSSCNVLKVVKLEKLGHTFNSGKDKNNTATDRVITPANCQNGAVYAVTCDVCRTEAHDATYSDNTPDPNAHNFNGDRKVENGVESYKCTVEGCNEYGNAKNCEYVVIETVVSTCKTLGYKVYKCDSCNDTYTLQLEAFDPNNHSGEGTYTEGATAPTCATQGSTGVVKCRGCNAQISSGINDIPVDPTNHTNMQEYDAVPATCQTPGYSAYTYCDKCQNYGTEKVTVDPIAHKYSAYVSAGNGKHVATCETCDPDVAARATDEKSCSGGVATCKTQATCKVCKAPYGELDADNHRNIVTVDKVAATCQTAGTEAYRKCTDCNTALEEIIGIPVLDHVYGAWTKLDGMDKHKKTCINCKEGVGEGIATVTEDCSGGSANCQDKATCKVCKAKYGTTNTAVHKTQLVTLKNYRKATCQSTGYSGDYCYDCCGAVKTAGKETVKLNHNCSIEVAGSRVPATCLKTGEVTYKCSTCEEGDGLTVQTKKEILPIDSTNHESAETKLVNDKAATCTENGYTGDVYYVCCNALKSRGSVIETDGTHSFCTPVAEYMIERIDVDADGKKTIVLKTGEISYDNKVAARHEDDGMWYHVEICEDCSLEKRTRCYTYENTANCVETDRCEVCKGLCSLKNVSKHKSDLVTVEGTAATCKENGTKDYFMCADCNKTYLDKAGKKAFNPATAEGMAQITIDKSTVSHTWNEGVKTEGTCGESGYILYTCTVCSATNRVNTGVSSGNHTWNKDYEIVKEATCGEAGYRVIKCETCGTEKNGSTVIIPATGEHTYGAPVIVPGTSCTAPGKKTETCTICGAEKTEDVFDDASAHKWGEWTTVSGDCSTGVTQSRKCNVCSAEERRTITTEAHSFSVKVRKEPTADAFGYVEKVCSNCGAEEKVDLVLVNGKVQEHKLGKYDVVAQANCKRGEIRKYSCTDCDKTFEITVGGPQDHVWLQQAELKATCTTEGHSAYYKCLDCSIERDKTVYGALGHKDTNNDGKCDVCGVGGVTNDCDCLCHKEGWFMKLVYKFVRFFWKLFKIGYSCDCGATHY